MSLEASFSMELKDISAKGVKTFTGADEDVHLFFLTIDARLAGAGINVDALIEEITPITPLSFGHPSSSSSSSSSQRLSWMEREVIRKAEA